MKRVYLLLALIGLILPYYFFISFLIQYGLDVQLMLSHIFANNMATFFVVDLLITALVFLIFSYQEAQRYRIRRWWVYLIATLLVGPSFSFPLFLYIRSDKI
jgi:hypothetical protein